MVQSCGHRNFRIFRLNFLFLFVSQPTNNRYKDSDSVYFLFTDCSRKYPVTSRDIYYSVDHSFLKKSWFSQMFVFSHWLGYAAQPNSDLGLLVMWEHAQKQLLCCFTELCETIVQTSQEFTWCIDMNKVNQTMFGWNT